MRNVVPSLLLVGLLSAVARGAQSDVTLVGTLEGGRIAIGGETSGWLLHYRDDGGDRSIEVEFEGDLPRAARNGARVKITGRIVVREYIERGQVRVLVASRIEESKK